MVTPISNRLDDFISAVSKLNALMTMEDENFFRLRLKDVSTTRARSFLTSTSPSPLS